jgi:mono/diheme cytochrome c family protein
MTAKRLFFPMRVAAALMPAGCLSLEQMAPPIDEAFLRTSPAESGRVQALRRGRDLYLGVCAKCHTVEPIGKYSVDKWREILPEMAEESKLNAGQYEDVKTYIFAARLYLDTPRGAAAGK